MGKSETYGPDVILVCLWVFLTGIPWPIAIYDAVKFGFENMAGLLVASAIVPLLVLVFAFRFRVTFTADEFIYRRWGPTIRVPYRDIVAIDVANVTPIEKQVIGAFIVTRNGKRFPFWPKLFPKAAVTCFFELAPLASDS